MLFDPAFLMACNHLLGNAEWARQRLRVHAGRTARFDLGLLAIDLHVTDEGLFAAADGEAEPDLVVELPPAALGQVVSGWDAVTRAAHLRGNVEFAEVLGFVLRNLRWDVEEDISRVTGDIAAHRIVQAGEALRRAVLDSTQRLADNVTEYALHEAALIAPKQAIADFCHDVDELRDAGERLEARLRRLEKTSAR